MNTAAIVDDLALLRDGGAAGQLLRRIPDLQQSTGTDRLRHFEVLCRLAVGELGPAFPPAAYAGVLLAVAAVGGVPTTAAIEVMERAVRSFGLIVPELAHLKQYRAAAFGDLDVRPPAGAPQNQGWQGGDQVRRPRLRRRDTKTAICVQWLQRMLGDGRPHPSLELQRRLLRARQLITQNSPFQDARKRLGVVIKRRGFGPHGRYEWSLPPALWEHY